MRFFTPWGFLALLAIPIILLMYFLKQKYKEKEIPSLFLWKKAFAQSKSHEPWQKLRKNILLFLQLAAATLLALALAGPYYMGKSEVTDYILVLDCSLSMQAEDMNGASRFETAKADIEKLIEQAPPETSISLITAESAPNVVLSGVTEKQTALKAVRLLEAGNGAPNWESVSSQVQGQKNALGGQVIIYTDDYNQLNNISAIENIYNQNGENTAITLLTYTQAENGYSALAKVKNYGQTIQERDVILYADGVALDTKKISLDGNQEADIVFSGVPEGTASISARIFPEDILVADDQRFAGLASASVKKALLVTEQNLFLEKALSLMSQIELYKITPANASDLSGYGLYIFDGWVPDVLPKDGYCLFFNLSQSNGIISVGNEKEMTQTVRAQQSDNLTDIADIQFELAKATPISVDWGQAFLRSGDNAVAVYGERDGRKTAVFGFDIHQSDLPLTAGFPVLLYRLMEWYFPESATGVSQANAGENLSLSLQPETQKAWIVTPDDKKVDIAPPFPVQPFTQTNPTGVYTLVEESGTGDTAQSYFGVNPVTYGESDLLVKEIQQEQEQAQTKMVYAGKSLRNILLLLVCALLMIEWRVSCREN